MKTSRRLFMTGAAQCGAGIGLTAIGAGEVRAGAAAGAPASERKTYGIHPIGTVEKGDTWVRVRIFDSFVDGLLGLQEWSHVNYEGGHRVPAVARWPGRIKETTNIADKFPQRAKAMKAAIEQWKLEVTPGAASER